MEDNNKIFREVLEKNIRTDWGKKPENSEDEEKEEKNEEHN